jgi:hypothetical protein
MHRPARGEFLDRARTYQLLDQGLYARTRFFGAAALINLALADLLATGFSRLCLSPATCDFLCRPGRRLLVLNIQTIPVIVRRSLPPELVDRAMVSMEQSEVQRQLEHLAFDNPDAHATTLSQLDRLLSLGGGRPKSTRFILRRVAYPEVCQVIHILGGSISFAKQRDRESVGQTLIDSLRARDGSRRQKREGGDLPTGSAASATSYDSGRQRMTCAMFRLR